MSMKRKENSHGDHPTPDSTTKEKTSFCAGDEVLMQRKDGNFYLGTIVKIDFPRELCQVKFGDNTETWSTLSKLTKLSTGLEVMCVKCKVSQTETDNDIVMCDKCSRGYHQKCHYPEIDDEFLKEDSKWECIRCCDVPEKRLLPQRKSSVSTPPPPPSPPPSMEYIPSSPPECSMPVPQISKPHTAKSSFQSVKPPAQVPKAAPLTPKSSPHSIKPSQQLPKPISQSSKPSPQPASKPSPQPVSKPSPQPVRKPSPQPVSKPTPQPVTKPSPQPVSKHSPQPVAKPSPQPTASKPSQQPAVAKSSPHPPVTKPSSQPSAKNSPCSVAKTSPQQTSKPSQSIPKTSSQPTAKPSPQPATKHTPQPVSKPSTQPAAKPSTHTVAKPSTQSTAKSSPQPAAKPSSQPPAKPSSQPPTKPSSQPPAKSSPQPTSKPFPQPTSKPSPQPTTKPSPQPASKLSPQPTTKPSPQPASKPSPQPASKPSPQPASKPSPQPASKPSPQSVAKPSPQPVAKPSPQPVTKPAPQPVTKPAPQPVTKLSPQPVTKPSPQPVTKPSPQTTTKQSPQPAAKPLPLPDVAVKAPQPLVKSPPQSTKQSTPLTSKSLSQSSKVSPSKPMGHSKSQHAKDQLKSSQPILQPHPSDTQPKSSSTPPTPPATPTESVCSALPVATEAQKKKLPYNLNDLHWDMQHRSNTENKYCYCAGPGKWFLKMLQCTRCRQWFHSRCLSSLRYPLFYGDRFYVFLCTLCNSGKEFLRRLEVKWVDLVHLATFNLTLKTAKKYIDVDNELLRFINSNWNELQLPPKILETTESEKREIVLSVFTSNRNRFKASREVKSRTTKWGLRVRVPPPTPVFSLPPNKPLSDQVLSDAWNNSARLKFLPPPPRNFTPSIPEDDFDLSNLKDQLPGVDILHIETRLLVLPKGVPASGHNVCIKSSTPMYPESRAIKRRIKEQGMENDRVRRSRKARRLLRSSLSKDREEDKERGELPPTPPSSESNPEAAPSALPGDTSGDETSSRGTLDSIIPPPVDFTGTNNPFLPLLTTHPLQPHHHHPVLRTVKRKLSEKDIIVTSTGEVKRRRMRRTRFPPRGAGGPETGGRGKLKRLKGANAATAPPTTSPVKSSPIPSAEELKSSVNRYFGAVNRINAGENFVVMAKRVGLDGRTQYLINWGTPT